MRSIKAAEKKGSGIISLIRGVFIGGLLSIALIVIYALLLQYDILQSSSVAFVNTVIKVLCSAAAAIIATRRILKRRWLFGMAAGGAYILFAFLVFSVLSGEFDVSLTLLSDMGMGMLTGMLSAMLFQTIK